MNSEFLPSIIFSNKESGGSVGREASHHVTRNQKDEFYRRHGSRIVKFVRPMEILLCK